MIMLALVVWMVGIGAADAQTCVSCPTGKYKTLNGNTVCSDCPENRYRNATGGVVESDCFLCPTNSMSVAGTPDILGCRCLPGFYMSTLYTCEMCPVGTFKSDLSSTVNCTTCPATGTTTEFRGMFSASNCTCNVGFGLNGGICQACSAGNYKSVIGNIGCITCGSNSISPIQSTGFFNCSCVAGYTGPNGGACVACDAGKYKSTSGAQTCDTCPTSSSSPSASATLTSCTCNVGFSGPDGGTCTACSAGKYKNATMSSCANCPADTYLPMTARTSIEHCAPCRPYSTSLVGTVSTHECYCKIGYVSDAANTTCTACLPGKFMQLGSLACSTCEFGKYAASSGNTNAQACLQCEAGKFSMTNQSQCDVCPGGTFSDAGSGVVTNCSCNAGFLPIVPGQLGGTCVPCEAGKYKETRGTAVCTAFQNGTYASVLGATSQSNASACAGNSTSPEGSTLVTQCACNAGFTGAIVTVADRCAACAAGKFKIVTGAVGCTDCPENTYSTAAARTNSTCDHCGRNAIAPAGSASSAACSCSAGYGLG